MELAAVLGEVGAFLEREHIPFAVVGALALHTYGHSRNTNDVDLLVGLEAQGPLISFLERHGFETRHRSDGFSNHLHADPAFGRLDVIYVDPDTRDTIFAEAVRGTLGGTSVVVPKPEHLAAMKIHAIKNDPSRAYFEKAGLLERFHDLEKTL